MEFDVSVLNDAQRNAMTDTEGAVLVLAGAGSGKTRVLTHRVAHLVLDKGVSPYNILAITFTNKATAEMRERLEQLLGENNRVWISTFHSLCYTILRMHTAEIGYEPNISIYDESDSGRLIKKALREQSLDGSSVKDIIRNHISTAKNKGLSPGAYYATIRGDTPHDEDIYRLYTRYEELLKLSNALDFDDLLHKTNELFDEHPEVLSKYQNRFFYIHVDEFQDTNAVQFDIVKKLAAKSGNIFVVGDDDQSIYGWRGADIKNILNFNITYPNAKVHKLLENYRSTSKILEAANNVIRHNKSRHEKELFTNLGSGVRIEYYSAYNDYQEAEWVVDSIISLRRYYGYQNKDFAILIRNNSLSRLFEKKLSASRLNYRIMGGFRFFDRKEIQDVIAYMRVANNTSDSEALERIINFPRRSIGETTVERLSEYSRQHMVELIDVIRNADVNGAVPSGAAKKVKEFGNLITDIANKKSLPLYEFVTYLVDQVGFEKAYMSTGKEEDENRWENIQEFLRHIQEFAGSNANADLDTFLQTAALQPERQEIYSGDSVAIATMHSVKGLEFRVVFIVACEEEIFPSSQSIKAGEVEEERRVMYVAITRAKERLYISHTINRFRFNKVQNFLPSRFIDESRGIIKENSYEVYGKKKAYIEGRGTKYGYEGAEREIIPRRANHIPKTLEDKPKIFNRDVSGFVGGARVAHSIYGEGKIILVLGEGDEATATVLFPKLGIKKFKIALAPLKLLS
ncbi:MAG: UvrD-helicase domain-containing protein [Clostridia bacterium]